MVHEKKTLQVEEFLSANLSANESNKKKRWFSILRIQKLQKAYEGFLDWKILMELVL